MSVNHYENFPVASVLCPPSIRPAVVAIYRFARTADDIADEGDADADRRLADLAAYRAELQSLEAGRSAGPRWQAVFAPLAVQVGRFGLDTSLLHDLIDAFAQDAGNPTYADRPALLDYCRRSANPIGRLLLQLYGVSDADSLRRSDAICSALQLINFWQDLGIDSARGRHYVPEADLHAHGLSLADLRARQDSPSSRRLVQDLCRWAGALMQEGAPLATRIGGRAGWELRLVVQGGLRILDRIAVLGHATLGRRPRLTATDVPLLLWRATLMRPAAAPRP